MYIYFTNINQKRYFINVYIIKETKLISNNHTSFLHGITTNRVMFFLNLIYLEENDCNSIQLFNMREYMYI